MKEDWIDVPTTFNMKEACCRCGCKDFILDHELLMKLQLIRLKFGEPITITSWYRCQKHNESVGGKLMSKHRFGLAVDIGIPYPNAKQQLIELAIEAGFNQIGIADSFLHLAIDRKKPKLNVFFYDKETEEKKRV